MTVDAVVFDLDGVLLDSEQIWDEVRRGLAAQHGRPWPADATRVQQGMSTPEWSAYLVETVGLPGRPEDVAHEVVEAMARRYDEALPLLPGAVAAVRRLAARWPLGLATSSPRRLLDEVLHVAGLTDAFRVTVSTEEVPAGKPDPAVYLTAVQRLGVAPGEAVAIEDSSNGLRSAHAAGLRVVAVPHEAYPPAPDALELADLVVADLASLTVERVGEL